MAQAEPVSAQPTSERSRSVKLPLGDLGRSLLGKLLLLMIVFIAVPIILYSEFRQADAEKRTLLLESVRAQGRLIAESLRPLLSREEASPLPELNAAIKPFATAQSGIKILYRPAGASGLEGFYFVASEPPVPAATLAAERDKLMQRGILERLAESCQGQLPMALRHRKSSGEEELFSSITPITTASGCWAVITTHSASEMLGTAIDQPYWRTVEVRVAAGIYVGMAVFTVVLFYTIWRGLRRFRALARDIGSGRAQGVSFVRQNNVPELAEVAEEFDRMTRALGDSAESIRRAAEDNAHAFKTPIAIMRQALEPLKRIVPEDNPRGRRAAEVIEESIDRLEGLVASARQLDQATAELLDARREEIDLSRLLERMLTAYADSLVGRGLRLESRVAPRLVVRAGEDLLETVIENVMDNAIEVSPRDSVLTVTLARDGRFARLAVMDRGPGVASENLQRIFERYVSLREETGAAQPGQPDEEILDAAPGGDEAADGEPIGPHLGIGLWIVRRNLQAVGGEVWAENRPDGGLAVIMRLPLA
ncbi:MAG TPA: HAMP domain-containing sensor histidine kinase [Kiloniellales bacterium]|nr:HAMP domain-containing sensor histidine kinase [Kiloniellales bacterium]